MKKKLISDGGDWQQEMQIRLWWCLWRLYLAGIWSQAVGFVLVGLVEI
jgi:hypothetical protein